MKFNLSKFTIMSILVAATIVLQTLSATMLRFFTVPVSLVMIPIAVSVILYGIKGGAIVGGTFGITVFVHGLTGFDAATNMLLTNPIYGESVVTRIAFVIIVTFVRCLLAGVSSGLFYLLIKRIKKNKIRYGIAGLITTICNTGIFILLYLMLFYNQTIAQATENGHANDWFTYFLLTVVLFNFAFEAITTTLITPPICIALKKSKNE